MTAPKIALFDVENAPSLGYFWGRLWETDIIGVKEPWYMLSFSYKWLGERKVYTKALCDYPLYNENKDNDFFLVKDLHKLFDEADILVAHNGDWFDTRKANARFLRYNMLPPSPYKTVDTLKVARKHFMLDSNKLGDLGQFLGLGGKLPHTGFDLWKRVMDGDPEAWKLMKKYNERDVKLLEEIYLKLRPYMPNHPHVGLYDGHKHSCPTCGSFNLTRQGQLVTVARRYQRLKCRDCGHWTKGDLIKDG